jgi:hypothetical protein
VQPERAGTVIEFAGRTATVPQPRHAHWYHQQMLRWRQIAPDTEAEGVVEGCFRSDLYASSLGLSSVPEAAGPEQLFDGSIVGAAHPPGA